MERLGRHMARLLALVLATGILLSPLSGPLQAEEILENTEEMQAFSEPADTDPPVINYFFLYVHIHMYGDTYQTALRAGDYSYELNADVHEEGGIPTLTVDLSELGIEEPETLWVERFGNSNDFTASQYGEMQPVPATVPDGPKTITLTATDPSGNSSQATYTVYVDNAAPEMTISSIARAVDGPLVPGSDVLLSGEVDGTGTDTRFSELWQREYDAEGVEVDAFRIEGMQGTSDLLSRRAGPFANVPLTVQSRHGDGTFHPSATSIAFSLVAVDEAGNLVSATSSRIELAAVADPEPQASNVLFLPGIKGSRLYSDEKGKLWVPFGNDDVRELFLNVLGKSVRDDVHVRVGDVLAQVEIPYLGGPRYYQSFIERLDGLQGDGTITDWEAVPYDWRLSLDDIINKGLEVDGKIYYTRDTDAPYIEKTLRELAASSKTGKVTIVAHSNGGLVAKALMQKLGDAETEALVDKVVFVGVPQTGAPHAVAALLYGFKENFPFPITSVTARSLAMNAPMPYHLLPSNVYFDTGAEVIVFNEDREHREELESYGPTIDSWYELKSFIKAERNERTAPDDKDLSLPIIGNTDLLTYAESLHSSLDSWVPPPEVKALQIAGWGKRTMARMEMHATSLPIVGLTFMRNIPIYTEKGDGVVPSNSALFLDGAHNVTSYWIDLEEIPEETDHSNLLEFSPVLDLIVTTISSQIEHEVEEPIYTNVPPEREKEGFFRFLLHSPLVLELYDEEGHRVGPNEDGSIDAQISKSSYEHLGEVQEIIVPSGRRYNLLLDGYSNGYFSLDIQVLEGNDVKRGMAFIGVPTSAHTKAYLTVPEQITNDMTLLVDSDGDGDEDIRFVSAIGQETVYMAPLVEGSDSAEQTYGGHAGGAGTAATTTNPQIDTREEVATGPTQFLLPRGKQPIIMTKDLEAKVLSALSIASERRDSETAIPPFQPTSWWERLMDWVYTLIIQILDDLNYLFSNFKLPAWNVSTKN